jgi:hypothetical protein
MGWPLAVSAGLIKRSSRAFAAALWTLTIGHLLAMLVMILPFGLLVAPCQMTNPNSCQPERSPGSDSSGWSTGVMPGSWRGYGRRRWDSRPSPLDAQRGRSSIAWAVLTKKEIYRVQTNVAA